MTGYIVRRLLWVVLALLLVSFITFLIFYLFPSADPAALRAGRNPALIPQIRKQYGLDKPVYEQFWLYLKRLVLHFDLGTSYSNNSVSLRTETELFE